MRVTERRIPVKTTPLAFESLMFDLCQGMLTA